MPWTNRIQNYFTDRQAPDPCKCQDLGLGFPLKLVASSTSKGPTGTSLEVRTLMNRDLEQVAALIRQHDRSWGTAAGLRDLLSGLGMAGIVARDGRTKELLGCLIYQVTEDVIVLSRLSFKNDYAMAKAGKPLLKALTMPEALRSPRSVTALLGKHEQPLVQLLSRLGFSVQVAEVQPTGGRMFFLKSSTEQLTAL